VPIFQFPNDFAPEVYSAVTEALKPLVWPVFSASCRTWHLELGIWILELGIWNLEFGDLIEARFLPKP
jgi:hypothetical protein